MCGWRHGTSELWPIPHKRKSAWTAKATKSLSENMSSCGARAISPGPASVKQEVTTFREGFPDVRITIEQIIAEGDSVAFRFVLRGTHLGTFAGFPPTGKENVLTGADFIRISNGKMVEMWSIQETLSWAQGLGFKLSS